MTTASVPEPLSGYFASQNTHDVDGMLLAFADEAVVKDEGQEHHGALAIRQWMESTIRKYRPVVEVIEVAVADANISAVVSVAGTFPGSPIRLRYAFTLAQRKIVRLVIG